MLSILAVHINMEKGLFGCTICGKAFPEKKRLTRHMGIHETVRPHKCVQCSKTFGVEANLRSHMRMHSGDKPRRRHQNNDTPEEEDHLLITGSLSHVKTD
jgi:uncharacterized Zn-finger protein